jgi:hypothetical protein
MPGDKVGLAWRLVAYSTGRGNAMADDRERIDRGRPVGGDWHEAKQDDVQGDRIDRQQSHASP